MNLILPHIDVVHSEVHTILLDFIQNCDRTDSTEEQVTNKRDMILEQGAIDRFLIRRN